MSKMLEYKIIDCSRERGNINDIKIQKQNWLCEEDVVERLEINIHFKTENHSIHKIVICLNDYFNKIFS